MKMFFLATMVFLVGCQAARKPIISSGSVPLPAGCTSPSGFSPTSGIPCSSLPAGCTSRNGFSATTGVPCSVDQNPTVNLSANPSAIQAGQSSTLSWNSQNANTCSSSWSGSNSTSGSQQVSPNSTTTYNITCYGINGRSVYASATIYVNQAQNPTVGLTARPSVIQPGQSSILYWNSQNAVTCSFAGGLTSGSMSVSPTHTTTYNINCTNGTQSMTASAAVYVVACEDSKAKNHGGNLPCRY